MVSGDLQLFQWIRGLIPTAKPALRVQSWIDTSSEKGFDRSEPDYVQARSCFPCVTF